jgi:hypothetical protein
MTRVLPYFVLAAGLAILLFGLALKPDPGEHDATLREGSDGFVFIGISVLAIGFAWALFSFLGRLLNGEVQQGAAPNSRPPRQLPASPEIQSSDSQRTPSSGGCG